MQAVAVASGQLLNHLLLLANDLCILGNDASKRLNAVMRLFQAHSHFSITPCACDRHVRAALFQMLFKTITSLVQFLSPRSVSIFAAERTWDFDAWTFLNLVLYVLLVG